MLKHFCKMSFFALVIVSCFIFFLKGPLLIIISSCYETLKILSTHSLAELKLLWMRVCRQVCTVLF